MSTLKRRTVDYWQRELLKTLDRLGLCNVEFRTFMLTSKIDEISDWVEFK